MIRKEWKSHGLQCKIVDGPFGNLNGYVAISKSHRAWGVDYNKLSIEVHGGLTFGQQGNKKTGLCDDEQLYWYGFDTSHYGDKIDYHDGIDRSGKIWFMEEVEAETESMAKQFSEMKQVIFLDYSAIYDIEKYYGHEFLIKLLNGELGDKTK